MDNQPELNASMRSILVDWLVEVHMKFRLEPCTLYLSINVIDRYLRLVEVRRASLQLVGVTALLLACKMEGKQIQARAQVTRPTMLTILPAHIQKFIHPRFRIASTFAIELIPVTTSLKWREKYFEHCNTKCRYRLDIHSWYVSYTLRKRQHCRRSQPATTWSECSRSTAT
jgi:Cyclin, N-terminal domain